MKNITIIAILAIFFSSCEKTVQLDVDQTQSQYIVEGLVTNQNKKHFVKISKSNSLYQTGQPPKVSDAEVQVTDNEGNSWNFIENEAGEYLSETAFAGKVGNIYTMTINVDGKTLTASDELFYVEPIDTLIAFIDEEAYEDPVSEGQFWDVYLFLIEPQETEDYYRYKAFLNDEELNESGDEITVFNDVGVAENINGVSTGYFYEEGDIVRIEWYSLSREAFIFYNSLYENLNNDGGVFSGQPANVASNISGEAVGFFQASSVDIKEVVIE